MPRSSAGKARKAEDKTNFVTPPHLQWIVGHKTRKHRKAVRVKRLGAMRETIASRMRARLLAHPRYFYLGEEMTDDELLAVYKVFGASVIDTLALRGEAAIPQVVDIRMLPVYRQNGHNLPKRLKANVSAFMKPQVSLTFRFSKRVREHAVALGLEDPNVLLQETNLRELNEKC